MRLLSSSFRFLALATLLLLLAGPAARAADRFYENLLRDGIVAAEEGDLEHAAKLFRLACFGLLEEPPALARCLTLLALAEGDLDDETAFRNTFQRILEVERRFAGYTRSELTTAQRRSLESRLVELVSPEVLQRSPTFRRLVPDTAEVETPLDDSGGSPTQPAGEAEPLPAPPAPLPEEVAAALAEARVGHGVTRDELRAELGRLRQLADRYPEISELQHRVAELAYRLRQWSDSRAYFERGGEIDGDQPALLFYSAVALYETGEAERAAEVLKRCLPRLQRNAFIDQYADKILSSER